MNGHQIFVEGVNHRYAKGVKDDLYLSDCELVLRHANKVLWDLTSAGVPTEEELFASIRLQRFFGEF